MNFIVFQSIEQSWQTLKFAMEFFSLSLFLEMFREVIESGFAKIIFGLEVNLEGLSFSQDLIDDL